ncbi:cytochrome P450 [Cryptococcus neoformans Bt120]|nr:cytochrome P450 [Cryptococcus neoformans var. grubii Bt120]
MMLKQLSFQPPTMIGSILLALVILVVWLLHVFVYKSFTSALKNVPCPPGGNGSQGHIGEIMNLQGIEVHQWIRTYGSTFMVRGPFGVHHRIFTIDPRALSHVLQHTNIYTKSDLLRDLVRRYMKEGLIVAEGERHKVQRKVSQKLFSMRGLKSMGQIVQDKSNQLRDILLNLCANPTASNPYSPVNRTLPPGSREVDVYSAASRCTFDLIGSIGVDHQFDSIADWEGSGGKLFHKYEQMQLLCPGAMGIRMLLSLTWPLVDRIWPSENTKRVNDAMGSLEKFAKEKMIERQQELLTMDSKKGDVPDRRDLLTLMLRHNMSRKISPADKLRDHEISGQLSTFMFAGSETTALIISGTISFGLYDLARHPDVQSRLRAEIFECGDNLPFDQIDELPYLDAVVKEIMRINPSLPGTVRQAQKDDIIPLAEPVTLTNGKVVTDIHIQKGQLVHVPIEHLHTSEHIWGPTAKEFDPSRFISTSQPAAFSDQLTLASNPVATFSARRDAVPSYVPEGPGIWPNFMTFIDGPRRCIGYKLAVMEIKTVIFTLLREFEIEPVEGQHIFRWNMMSNRPFVANTLWSKGSRLPLHFKLYKGEQ